MFVSARVRGDERGVSGLARLRRAVVDCDEALDMARVWALAAALRRVNSPWGEVLGAACPVDDRAPTWERVCVALEVMTAEDWDEGLEALTLRLLERAGVAARTPLACWMTAAAQGLACPALRLVNTLDCNEIKQLKQQAFSAWGDAEWEAVCRCPDLRGMRSLSLTLRVPHLSIWRALAHSAWLNELTSLTLCALRADDGMTDAQCAALIARPWERLERLRLERHRLADLAVRALCDSAHFESLRALRLDSELLSDPSVRALSRAPVCQQLTELDLNPQAAEPLLTQLESAQAVASMPDVVLRWVVLSCDPEALFAYAPHPHIFERLTPRLADLLARAPLDQAASLLLTHLCESGEQSLRAQISALSGAQVQSIAARVSSRKVLCSHIGWRGYAIWALLPLNDAQRASALLDLLEETRPGTYFPWGVPPNGDGTSQPLNVRLLRDLCTMQLDDAAARRRLAILHKLSKGQLTSLLSFDAFVARYILDPNPSGRQAMIALLREHLRDAKSPSIWITQLSTWADFPVEALREIAHLTLTSRSGCLRAWGFTTLGAYDVFDDFSRDAFLIARTMTTHRDGAPFLEALRNGWLPRCLEALTRDRFTAADTHRFPTLRALRGAPLRRALEHCLPA